MRSLWVSMNAAVYLYHNHNDIRIAGSIFIPIELLVSILEIQMNLLTNVFYFRLR